MVALPSPVLKASSGKSMATDVSFCALRAKVRAAPFANWRAMAQYGFPPGCFEATFDIDQLPCGSRVSAALAVGIVIDRARTPLQRIVDKKKERARMITPIDGLDAKHQLQGPNPP